MPVYANGFIKRGERLSKLEAEGQSAVVAGQRLEATAKTAENEVIAVEAKLHRKPAAAAAVLQAPSPLPAKDGAYVFKRNCKVFDQPTKDAKVLLIQKGGTEVAKTDEGRTWIAFALPDGRKGYSSKTCF